MLSMMMLLWLGVVAAHDSMGFRGAVPSEKIKMAVDASGFIEGHQAPDDTSVDTPVDGDTPPPAPDTIAGDGAGAGDDSSTTTDSTNATESTPTSVTNSHKCPSGCNICRILDESTSNYECVDECGPGEAPDANTKVNNIVGTGECARCDAGGEDPPRIYADHVNHLCVTKCPAGSAPNAELQGTCELCSANNNGLDYADHVAHACVAKCRPGHAPNAAMDCEACPHEGTNASLKFADHTSHTCVAQNDCAPGYAPKSVDPATEETAPGASGASDASTGGGVDGSGVATSPVVECGLCGGMEPFVCDVSDECPDMTDSGDATINGCVEKCPDGYGANAAKKCVKCETPTPFTNKELNKCVANCAYGYAPHTSASVCTQCESITATDGTGAPKIADHENQLCVEQCPDGWAPDITNTCRDCSKIAWNPTLVYANHKDGACVDTCENGCKNDDTMNCDDGDEGTEGKCALGGTPGNPMKPDPP